MYVGQTVQAYDNPSTRYLGVARQFGTVKKCNPRKLRAVVEFGNITVSILKRFLKPLD